MQRLLNQLLHPSRPPSSLQSVRTHTPCTCWCWSGVRCARFLRRAATLSSTLSMLVRDSAGLLAGVAPDRLFFSPGIVNPQPGCSSCPNCPSCSGTTTTTTSLTSTPPPASTTPAVTTPPPTSPSEPPTRACLSARAPCDTETSQLDAGGRLCLSGQQSPFGNTFDVQVSCNSDGQTTVWAVCAGAAQGGCAGCRCGCAYDALLTANANALLALPPAAAPNALTDGRGVCLAPLTFLPVRDVRIRCSCV